MFWSVTFSDSVAGVFEEKKSPTKVEVIIEKLNNYANLPNLESQLTENLTSSDVFSNYTRIGILLICSLSTSI